MPHLRLEYSWALLASITLGACADGGGEWQGTITDSAGIALVTNSGAGLWGTGEGWTVEEEVRIGTAAGEPEYQFGLIVGIDVGEDGRIYVMDQQASEVRIFDADGRFVSSIGKPGAGPGELGPAAGPVFVGPGDTISVPDASQQRLTRFTSEGEPAGSYSLPMTGGIPVKWMETPDGELVQQAMIMAMPGQENVEPRNLLLHRAPNGQILDTLKVMPASQTMDFSGGQPRMTIFAPEPMWAIRPDGTLLFGNNAEYRIEVLGLDGEVRRIIRKEQVRRPISDGDQEEFRRVIEAAWERAGMPPQALEMMSQALHFAPHYPAFANFVGGPGATTWVQGVQSPESVQEAGGTFDIQDIGGPDWEVFDAEGRLLGVVRMPDRFMPLLFEGDHVYGVLRDDLDIQYAARMRLNRGPAGLEG
ncbi:MAG TPA: 6-bladed beta-propeller [Longimicrobiales bacterium]|nr:6-bladed beta-propeller [Longimicrobiales bacterium]